MLFDSPAHVLFFSCPTPQHGLSLPRSLDALLLHAQPVPTSSFTALPQLSKAKMDCEMLCRSTSIKVSKPQLHSNSLAPSTSRIDIIEPEPEEQRLEPSSGPTLLTLPKELHLEIASYLQSSSILVLSKISNESLQNVYKAPPQLSTNSRAVAMELLTRDAFEAVLSSHIQRYRSIKPSKFSTNDRAIIYRTQFYCYRCSKGVSVRHFPWPQIRESVLLYEGEEKAMNRECRGAVRKLRVGNMEKVEWWEFAEAKKRLMSAPVGEDGRASIDVRVWEKRSRKGNKRRKSGKAKFYPEKYLRVVKTSSSDREGKDKFETDHQFYWTLRTLISPFSHCSQTRVKAHLRISLLKKRPRFCPHMDWHSLLFDADYNNFTSNQLSYLVNVIYSDVMPWEDAIVENGEVLKKVKSMETECMDAGCRTEVALQRARCKIGKKGGGKKRVKKKEAWKEFVWVIVRRKWRVDTPSSLEWRVAVALQDDAQGGLDTRHGDISDPELEIG